jgi:GTPase Era involved in 16S rRNA processing
MKNRILLFGETGDGKSSFINAFFGKKVAPVSKDAKKCTVYVTPYKDQRGNETYTLIDTPGLNDIEKEEENNKKQIMKTLEEEIKGNSEKRIKCILIFRRYDESRLKGSHINALKFLMDLFPIHDFWKHVIIIRSFTTYINQLTNKTNEQTKERINKLFDEKKQSLLVGLKEEEDLLKKMGDLNINIPDKINMKFVDSYDELNDKINDNEYMQKTMNEILGIIKPLPPLFEYFEISDKTKYIGGRSIPYKEIKYKDFNGILHTVKNFEGNSKFTVDGIKATTPPYGKTCKKGKFQKYQKYKIFFDEKGEYLDHEKDGEEDECRAPCNEKNTEYIK